MAESGKEVRRRKFQFSLRTLILVVLGYVLLWGITLSFGRSDMQSHQISRLQGTVTGLSTDKDGNVIVDWNLDTGLKFSYRGVARSPFPLIIIWNWQQSQPQEIDYEKEIYLWLFGFKIKLYEEPYRGMRRK